MATAQEVFKQVMRDKVAPALREMGFRGSGQNFHLPSETHWALLGFQRSQWSDSDEVAFTANMTVVARDVWEACVAEYPALGAKPGANWSPAPIFASVWAGGYWHSRIGEATGVGDTWWTVGAGDDAERVVEEVSASIRNHGLPAMLAQMRL